MSRHWQPGNGEMWAHGVGSHHITSTWRHGDAMSKLWSSMASGPGAAYADGSCQCWMGAVGAFPPVPGAGGSRRWGVRHCPLAIVGARPELPLAIAGGGPRPQQHTHGVHPPSETSGRGRHGAGSLAAVGRRSTATGFRSRRHPLHTVVSSGATTSLRCTARMVAAVHLCVAVIHHHSACHLPVPLAAPPATP